MFSVDEVRHVFLPRKNVVNSYVVRVRDSPGHSPFNDGSQYSPPPPLLNANAYLFLWCCLSVCMLE